MAKSVKAVYFESRNIGKHIKATKKKVLWKVELNGRPICVEMYLSKLTAKVKVLVNGDIKLDAKRNSGSMFAYSFKIDKTIFMIMQKGEDYDLRIDNVTFQELYVREVGRPRFEDELKENDEQDNEWDAPKSKPKTWDPKTDPFEKAQWMTKKEGDHSDWEAEPQPYENPYAQIMRSKTSPNLIPPKKTTIPTVKSNSEPKVAPAPQVRASLPSTSEPKRQPVAPDIFDLMASNPLPTIPEDLFTAQANVFSSLPCNDFVPTKKDEFFTAQETCPDVQQQHQHNPFVESQLFYTEKDSLQALATGVVDLDRLHLGDKYSPAVAAKLAPKAIAQSDRPNVPMYKQMQTTQPQQTQSWSPMQVMQYMTGMMMQQMSQRPQ